MDSDKNVLPTLPIGYVDRLLKYGPSWALLFFLVGFLCWGTVRIVQYIGPTMKDYVEASKTIDQQNAKHVATLVATQELTSSEHRSMLEALIVLQKELDRRREEHTSETASINKLLSLIENATKTMSVVPAQRAEQLALLEQIKKGIDELRNSIEASNGHATPE
jgi:membrane protein required for beta-lactamase induction